MSAGGAGGDGGTKQRFELYIKASAIDKETKGSCPICQHWFMITCLLGENQDDIDFKVYTVQADCPPKNFGVDQGWSKKFPVVMVLEGRDKKGQDLTGTKYDTFEELETFFESINKDSRELKRKNAPNVAAMQAVEDVYNAFNTSLSMGKPNKRLMSALKKINDFLESDDECKFLVDNVLSFADCYLLPRLQHIRVAGKEYLDFDIPEEYTLIWKYLADAYKTEAFRSTMPSDQDIVFHYEKKAGNLLQRQKRRPRPTLQNFTYTLDVPEGITAMLQALATPTANGEDSLPPPPEHLEDTAPQPQQEEVTVNEEEVTVNQEEVTVNQEEVTINQEEVTDNQEEVADNQEEVTVDQEVAVNQEEVAVNQEEVAVNQEEVAVNQEVSESQEEVAVREEVVAVKQEEVAVSQEAEVVSAEDGVVGEEEGAVSEGGVAVSEDTTAEEVPPTQEASHEPPSTEETPEETVTATEIIVTQASPTPDEEEAAVAAVDEGQKEDGADEGEVADDGNNDDGVVAASTDTVGGSDAVSDDVTDASKDGTDDGVGVKITVGGEDEGVVHKEVGNGDVVKEKGDDKAEVIKADDPVASVDGSAE